MLLGFKTGLIVDKIALKTEIMEVRPWSVSL